jgi:hypothetical protein
VSKVHYVISLFIFTSTQGVYKKDETHPTFCHWPRREMYAQYEYVYEY